jgi:hypothetical protein
VSHPLIKKYWDAFNNYNIGYEQLDTIADSALDKALKKTEKTKTVKGKYQTLFKYLPTYSKELKRTGVTLKLLWEEYRQQHPIDMKIARQKRLMINARPVAVFANSNSVGLRVGFSKSKCPFGCIFLYTIII